MRVLRALRRHPWRVPVLTRMIIHLGICIYRWYIYRGYFIIPVSVLGSVMRRQHCFLFSRKRGAYVRHSCSKGHYTAHGGEHCSCLLCSAPVADTRPFVARNHNLHIVCTQSLRMCFFWAAHPYRIVMLMQSARALAINARRHDTPAVALRRRRLHFIVAICNIAQACERKKHCKYALSATVPDARVTIVVISHRFEHSVQRFCRRVTCSVLPCVHRVPFMRFVTAWASN